MDPFTSYKAYIHISFGTNTLRLFSANKMFYGIYVTNSIQDTLKGPTIDMTAQYVSDLMKDSSLVDLLFCYERGCLTKNQKKKLTQLIDMKDADVTTQLIKRYLSLLYDVER